MGEVVCVVRVWVRGNNGKFLKKIKKKKKTQKKKLFYFKIF